MSEKAASMTAVRNLDTDLWHRLRMVALQRKLSVGQLLNEIIREWLTRLE